MSTQMNKSSLLGSIVFRKWYGNSHILNSHTLLLEKGGGSPFPVQEIKCQI